MIEPYVDEEVAWAVKTHQALRFFPDESVGYGYPDLYKELFGPDYKPEPYIVEEYKSARAHKWYMTSRLILRERHLFVRPEWTSSAAISSSRKKALAVHQRTCGGRFCG